MNWKHRVFNWTCYVGIIYPSVLVGNAWLIALVCLAAIALNVSGYVEGRLK